VPLKSIFKWHLNLSGVGATGPKARFIAALCFVSVSCLFMTNLWCVQQVLYAADLQQCVIIDEF